MERLDRKFGGTRRQVAVYLEELDNFRPIRNNVARELERFSDLLEVAVVNLKAAGRHAELEVGTLYSKLQQKLTEEMLTQYHRWVHEQKQIEGVEALLEWVNLEASFHVTANEAIEGLAGNSRRSQASGKEHSKPSRPHQLGYSDPFLQQMVWQL